MSRFNIRPSNVRQFVDRWSLRRARYQPERNPKVGAILVCIAINLTPTAVGLRPLPGSLAEYAYLGQVATAAVVIGCLLCVVGIAAPRRYRDAALAIESGGCGLLAFGMFLYSAALLLFTSADQRAVALGESIGIAIGCVLRFGQIMLYVHGRRLASEEQARSGP